VRPSLPRLMKKEITHSHPPSPRVGGSEKVLEAANRARLFGDGDSGDGDEVEFPR
jgi:hypothetical protein